MAKAGEKRTSSETPIPFSKAALEVLKFCSAKEAEPVMMRGLKDLRIPLSWRRLEGLCPGDPTPDQIEFWQKRDPRTGGNVQHSPRFPWDDDLIVRAVYSRYDPCHRRQLFRRCKVWGTAVTWSDVVAVFQTDAQLRLPEIVTEPADDSSQAPSNRGRRSPHRKVGRPPALTPQEIRTGRAMVRRADRDHRKRHPKQGLKISAALVLLRENMKRDGKPIKVSGTTWKVQIIWPVLRPDKTNNN